MLEGTSPGHIVQTTTTTTNLNIISKAKSYFSFKVNVSILGSRSVGLFGNISREKVEV